MDFAGGRVLARLSVEGVADERKRGDDLPRKTEGEQVSADRRVARPGAEFSFGATPARRCDRGDAEF